MKQILIVEDDITLNTGYVAADDNVYIIHIMRINNKEKLHLQNIEPELRPLIFFKNPLT